MAKEASMGKMQLSTVFFLLLWIGVFAITAAANVYSESFPLVESASVTRTVLASEGDRIVGNFTVSKIPTWTDSNTGNATTIQYAFKVSKIEGSEKCPDDIVLYEVGQTEHASFDVYCPYTGDYRFRFNVGDGASDIGIGGMQATLNYEVIQNSSNYHPVENLPTSTSQPNVTPPQFKIETTPPLFVGVAVCIVTSALGAVYVALKAKGLVHRNKTI
jgi:hypothetical protein